MSSENYPLVRLTGKRNRQVELEKRGVIPGRYLAQVCTGMHRCAQDTRNVRQQPATLTPDLVTLLHWEPQALRQWKCLRNNSQFYVLKS